MPSPEQQQSPPEQPQQAAQAQAPPAAAPAAPARPAVVRTTSGMNPAGSATALGVTQRLVSQDKHRTVVEPQKSSPGSGGSSSSSSGAAIDLDLTYITPRVIAMGVPATGVKSLLRNRLSDVLTHLDAAHGVGNWRLINLTEEQSYSSSNLAKHAVVWCGWADHHAPPLFKLWHAVQEMRGFLAEDKRHVVAVHCLAGRGRTGTVVAAFLLAAEPELLGLDWNNQEMEDPKLFIPPLADAQASSDDAASGGGTAADSLAFFAKQRSRTQQGVSTPAQIRYVGYVEQLLRKHRGDQDKVTAAILAPQPRLRLDRVAMTPLPDTKDKQVRGYVSLMDPRVVPLQQLFTTKNVSRRSHMGSPLPTFKRESDAEATIPVGAVVQGDVLVYVKHLMSTVDALPQPVAKTFKKTGALASKGLGKLKEKATGIKQYESTRSTAGYSDVEVLLFRAAFHTAFLDEANGFVAEENMLHYSRGQIEGEKTGPLPDGVTVSFAKGFNVRFEFSPLPPEEPEATPPPLDRSSKPSAPGPKVSRDNKPGREMLRAASFKATSSLARLRIAAQAASKLHAAAEAAKMREAAGAVPPSFAANADTTPEDPVPPSFATTPEDPEWIGAAGSSGLAASIDTLGPVSSDDEEPEVQATPAPAPVVPLQTDARFTLRVRVIDARGLPAMDRGGTSDPYVEVRIQGDSHRQKTRTIKKTLDPFWDETLSVYPNADSFDSGVLQVKVYDYNTATANDYIGEVDFLLPSLLSEYGLESDIAGEGRWHALTQKFSDKASGGELRLAFEFGGIPADKLARLREALP